MNEGNLGELACVFGQMSLLAIGGANAMVPEIHRQIVTERNFVGESTFADLFALSQIVPGPNILIVSLVGWQVAGLAGLMVATLAMLVPSCLLALLAGRAVHRYAHVAWLGLVQEALAPIVIGLILASGLLMASTAIERAGFAVIAAIIASGAALFVLLTERNPLWAIALGGGTSLLLWATGISSL